MNNYPIQNIPLSAPERVGAIGALYGIGVSTSILRSKVEGFSKSESQYPSSTSDGFSPDAYPNEFGYKQNGAQWDGKMSSALSGMPVMTHIEFVGGSYLDLQGITRSFPTIDLETVLVTLTMGRSIKKTSIQGNYNGDVKEYIGNKDWQVEIRAIITSDAPVNSDVEKRHSDGVYPRQNMEEIWSLFQAPVAIPVRCWFLNMFNINHLVIDDGARIEQIEGEYSMQRLVIPCVSDNPLIITIAQ